MLDELTSAARRPGDPAAGSAGPSGPAPDLAETVLRRVAVLGNHLPRHCGIATFTTHLANALAGNEPAIDFPVVAVNDPGKSHAYPPGVRFEIAEADTASYQRCADYLNVNGIDLVSVQHEFGIFGGKAGSHLLLLLRELRMPVVTTLHTILEDPDSGQRRVMDEIARLSQRLVVMSAHGARVLARTYAVAADRIDVIPHGIPSVPETTESKKRLGVAGHAVMFTFGLLSPDKGIEYVIEALPAIVAAHPEVVYIVLGATHPHVKERHGDAYRVMLETLALQLGMQDHVIFHDRFVGQEELNEFLGATDIYVTPYLNPAQSTSGTLAYALGSGRAVISTPYAYARELLADDRGLLVPWRDPAAIAGAVTGLLDDPARRHAIQERAARHGQTMRWPAVAQQYLACFTRAALEYTTDRRATLQVHTLASRLRGLPELNLRHLAALTDDTGLLQHATFCVPRYSEGYCIDDNARALMLMARIEEAGTEEQERVRTLATRYLAFVYAAFNPANGRFRNFLSYSRAWMEDAGSEDSHGRGLQALGTVVGRSSDPGRKSLAGELFHAALPVVRGFTSPRAWATTLLGLDEYLHAFEGDRHVQELRTELADRLLALYCRAHVPDWPWFEDSLTYANAQLPHALMTSGARMNRPDLLEAGLSSLEWLLSLQGGSAGPFTPIGTNGFAFKGGTPATFDQQPIEAATTVAACLEAERLTGNTRWGLGTRAAFDWFLGQNHLHQWLYDPSTGGCRDGLHADRVNENQGAESTLAFLLSLVDMRALDRASQAPAAVTTT